MSTAERHAEFLTERLRAFGLSIHLDPGAASAEGVLGLAPTPFETLGRPLLVARARRGAGVAAQAPRADPAGRGRRAPALRGRAGRRDRSARAAGGPAAEQWRSRAAL